MKKRLHFKFLLHHKIEHIKLELRNQLTFQLIKIILI